MSCFPAALDASGTEILPAASASQVRITGMDHVSLPVSKVGKNTVVLVTTGGSFVWK